MPTHWRQPTQKHRATYPGVHGAVYIDIIVDRLLDAYSDSRTSVQSQKFIIEQFRKAWSGKFGRSLDIWLIWRQLDLEPVDETPTGRRAARKPRTEERHCCPDEDCTVCDIGNHHHCRKGCTLFV